MFLFDRLGIELRGKSTNLSQYFSIPYLLLTHKLLEQSFPKVWPIDQLFQRDMKSPCGKHRHLTPSLDVWGQALWGGWQQEFYTHHHLEAKELG